MSSTLPPSNAVTSTPTTFSSDASTSRSSSRLQPAGHGELRRHDRRVEHVEVQVDVERPGAIVAERLRRPLARVQVADADAVHALRLQRGREARVPQADRRAQAHPAQEAARRRLGRVGVPVRVEPHDPHVRDVLDDGGERRQADRAVRGRQHREPAFAQRLVDDLAGALDAAAASRADPRPSSRSGARGVPITRASGSSASASASAPSDAPGVRSDVRQRSAVTLTGRSTPAPASRRTPSRPPGCPRSRTRA